MKNIAILNTVTEKSTGKIASGLYKYLKQKGYKTFFCYGRGSIVPEDGYYRIDSKAEVYFHALWTRLSGLRASVFATKRLLSFFEKENIDIVYVLNLNGYYLNSKLFFDYIIKKNIRLVYIMIDEFAFLGKCCYSGTCDGYLHGCSVKCPQQKDYPSSLIFNQANRYFAQKQNIYGRLRNSVFCAPEYVIKKAQASPLLGNCNLQILDECIDTDFYCPRDTEALRKRLGISAEKRIIVTVADMKIPRKGSGAFIKLAQLLQNEENLVFVHVGNDGKESPYREHFIPVPYVSDQNELAEYYSLADAFVFLSDDDTMPNTCLEALSCGSPLICFNVSGMPYLGDESVMTLVEYDDFQGLCEVVRTCPKKNERIISQCRQYALGRYDNKQYHKKLEELGTIDFVG